MRSGFDSLLQLGVVVLGCSGAFLLRTCLVFFPGYMFPELRYMRMPTAGLRNLAITICCCLMKLWLRCFKLGRSICLWAKDLLPACC